MRLAARGARDLDRGEETVTDPSEIAELRRRAREVHAEAALLALALTALGLLIPW